MMFKHLCDQTCDYLFNVTSPGAPNPPPPYEASLNSPCSVMPAVPVASAAWTLPLLSSHTMWYFFYVIFQTQPGNHQGSLSRDIAVCTDILLLSIPCVCSVLQCHSILLSWWLIGGLCFPCIFLYLRLSAEQRPWDHRKGGCQKAVLAKLKGKNLEMKLQKSGPQGDLDIFKPSALITTNGCKVNIG